VPILNQLHRSLHEMGEEAVSELHERPPRSDSAKATNTRLNVLKENSASSPESTHQSDWLTQWQPRLQTRSRVRFESVGPTCRLLLETRQRRRFGAWSEPATCHVAVSG
jgi:hypothetical protein